MNPFELQYLQTAHDLLTTGDIIQGRNGKVYTKFGTQLVFENVGEQFPLLTTKRVHFKSILVELLWFIKGLTNVEYLHKHNVTIWDEWADEQGELGPVYGSQWRSWRVDDLNKIDQLKNLIEGIKKDPFGRRHIVSAWNPAEVDNMALPPCHTLFQFNVNSVGELDVQLYQRSADWFLGVPFNIASYALLLILVAKEVGLCPGKLVHTFGNYHIYENHVEAMKTQLTRRILPSVTKVSFMNDKSMFDLEPEDIILEGYTSHESIKAPVSR